MMCLVFILLILLNYVGWNIICSPVYPGVGGDAHTVCDRSIDVFISYRRSTGSQLARCLYSIEFCIQAEGTIFHSRYSSEVYAVKLCVTQRWLL